jgi:hypothetical protein
MPSPMPSPMPPTAAVELEHWITEGRHDDLLRMIIVSGTGSHLLPLHNSSAAM